MEKLNQKRNPVLLIHGIWDTGKVFYKMVPYLNERGWDKVYHLDLKPNNGDAPLEELAQQVAEFAIATFGDEQIFDLIGFSMGGIISRYYLQRLGGIKRIQRFITISSPHNGTLTGYGSLKPGCKQMRYDSELLADLNKDVEMLKEIEFTSIWTPYDLMILPPTSSKISFGREVTLPVLVHAWMLTDSRCLEAVMEGLIGNC